MDILPSQLDAAAAALAVVLPCERPADAVLHAWFRAHPKLGARDRAFIADAVFTVLRHLRRLEAAAGTRDPRVLALAALVTVLGRAVRSLTALVSEGESRLLATMKAAGPDPSQAVRLSLPDWLLEVLEGCLPADEIEVLGRRMLETAPLDLRVNTWKASRDSVLQELRASGIDAEPTRLAPAGIRVSGKPAIEQHPLFTSGQIEVQDEGSQLVACLVQPKRGEMVADFCAGAGGKTLALGALMRSAGRLYAFDTSASRLANLDARLKRSGLSNVHPQRIAHETDTRVKRLAGKIDAVLVDAPCSGTGTLRRNPDLKWRMSPADVAELIDKQRRILDSAAWLPKPGGRLVYATCSLLPSENEAQVTAFLASHPGWQLCPAGPVLAKQGIPVDAGATYLQLWPHRDGTDGFFAALLQRTGQGEPHAPA